MSESAARLRSLRDDLNRRLGRREALEAEIGNHEAAAAVAERLADLQDSAIEVLQAATEARREELRERVEVLVTRGLRAVFGRADLEFVFRTSFSRDVFGISPAVRSKFGDRMIEEDVIDGHGGGIADVVSFVLRVVVLSLSRPKVAPFVVLDEAFRHVSTEYLRGCGALLRELNRSAGIQFLLVTHKAELVDAADVVYRVSNQLGVTSFELEHDLRDESFHAPPARGRRPVDEASAYDNSGLAGPEPRADVVVPKLDDPEAAKQRGRAAIRRRRELGASKGKDERVAKRIEREVRRDERDPGWRQRKDERRKERDRVRQAEREGSEEG